DSAIAQAAHDTLVAVFPAQQDHFNQELAADLALIPDSRAKRGGIAVGRRAASQILGARTGDGSEYEELTVEQYGPGDGPGVWRQDRIGLMPLALGAKWGSVTPFVMQWGAQFRSPVPPALSSARYATAYNEVKRLGGDGITTATERTDEQTIIGTFWAY